MNNSDHISVEELSKFLMRDFNFHNQSSSYATHNFHSFPAKFPPQLPREFIIEYTNVGDTVLDPMVGSGTTLVEAILLGRNAVGFDIDPLAINLSKVKTSYVDRKLLAVTIDLVYENAKIKLETSNYDLSDKIIAHFDQNTLAFLNKWFLPRTQSELFALSQEISGVENDEIRRFLQVSFSSIIVTKSGGVSLALDLGHTRPHIAKKVTDDFGNTIIGIETEKYPPYATKIIRPALSEFLKKCQTNIKSLPDSQIINQHSDIRFCDAQLLQLDDECIDLIVTSPPYAANAIDYMRAHKFSLVWFGYHIDELSQKRRGYIGGESLIGIRIEDLPEYPASIVDKLASIDKKRSVVLLRYYSEMTRVLLEMKRVLKPGKLAIVVVGNSIIKGIDTNTAYCLSEIGKSIGFTVPAIGSREIDRNKRMLPVGSEKNLNSLIEKRMHEEFIIGFLKR